MKISEMKELFKSGNHELAIHGYHHPFFSMLRSEKVLTEVLDDRRKLESEMGMIVRGMAYPDTGVSCFHNGTTYEVVKNYLTELDIAYARALNNYIDDFSLLYRQIFLLLHGVLHDLLIFTSVCLCTERVYRRSFASV